MEKLLYEIRNKNVKLCHYERHKKEALINHRIFEDSLLYGLIFELFQITHINI